MFGYTLIKTTEHKRLQLIKKVAKDLVTEMGNDYPDHRYRNTLITALRYHFDQIKKKDDSDLS